MRRLQPKPKTRRSVPIPGELRESLRQVVELLRRAENDPDIVLDCDDAIQVDAVCGGRYGKDPRPYVLTYAPKDDRERGRWLLTLHPTEIEDIADGVLSEISLYCCTSPECGGKFRDPEAHCPDCDFVDDPSYGTFRFPEAEARLAQRGVTGLSADSTRADVVARLGPPDETGGGVKHPALGYVRPWINYRRADCQLRFAFEKGRRINSVTVLGKDWQPGR